MTSNEEAYAMCFPALPSEHAGHRWGLLHTRNSVGQGLNANLCDYAVVLLDGPTK